MNGVDNADQLRCYYSTQKVHFKSQKLLQHFLLDTAITNSYKIAYYVPKRVNKASQKSYSYREFRIQLASQLFESLKRLSGKASTIKYSLSIRVYSVAAMDYSRLEYISKKPQVYVPCLYIGRKVAPVRPRKPLLELSNNSFRLRDIAKRKRRERVLRSIFSCKLCGIYIYNYIGYWKEHIIAISCKQIQWFFSRGMPSFIEPSLPVYEIGDYSIGLEEGVLRLYGGTYSVDIGRFN